MTKPVKTFKVFGETIEILVPTASTNGSFCILVQTSPPGGGPPPHAHLYEDEIFTVLEGDFELFDGERWQPAPKGVPIHTLRNNTHTFRNSGTTDGRMQCVVVDGKLDDYLEAISPLEVPRDMDKLREISERFGIVYARP